MHRVGLVRMERGRSGSGKRDVMQDGRKHASTHYYLAGRSSEVVQDYE